MVNANAYHFFTDWRVKARAEEISEVLGDATELPRWWPAVYLDVQRVKAGDENRIGEEISLYTKGFLPYTLRWSFIVTEVIPHKRIKLESRGDFVGYGIWTFEQDGEYTNVRYEWNIEAQKPLLKTLSPILKPIFEANHKWAMQTGLTSLELELQRRRATSDEERAQIAAPPAPTSSSPMPYVVGMVGGLLLLRRVLKVLFPSRRKRRRR